MFTLGVEALYPIRGDSRYIRALRPRKSLSFSEATHQPMLSNYLYLTSAGVRSRLDGAVLEQDKLFGVLSLEYLDPTPLSDEMLPVAELHQQTGIDYARPRRW